jgi:hypothetical protein
MRRGPGLLALLLLAGCRAPDTGLVKIDPRLAAMVPADTTMLAGVRMDEIRASPLLKLLPGPRDGAELLLASNGKEIVTLTPQSSSATAKGGIPAALRDQMRSISIPNQVWVVSLGWNQAIDSLIPQSGNWSNLRRIYRSLASFTLAADLRSGLNLVATGTCRSDEEAENLAGALGGFVSLARLAHDSEIPKLYDAIKVEHSRRSIRVTARIPQDLLERIISSSSGSTTGSPPPHRP